MRRSFFLLPLLWLPLSLMAQPDTVQFSVSLAEASLRLPKFWRSTGYTPASLTLLLPMQATLHHLDAVPKEGMRYVRTHYLLAHVRGEQLGTLDQQLDFGGLDSVLDVFVANGQKPIFELMGNPGQAWTDWYDSTQVIAWKNLVRDLARHCQARYGQAEVRSWYFETINEPEFPIWWSHGVLDFMHYYDACAQGLAEADSALRFGGPGSAQYYGFMWRVLLEHAHHGYHWFGGKRGAKLDFISVHRKALPHQMVKEEANMLQHVRDHFPAFDSVAWWNDEADPMVGWGKPLWWRPGPWYAAFVAQSVDLHARHLIDTMGVRYGMLSNDHGFLGDWGQRTQLMRFVPAVGDPSTYDRFYLVKKPAFAVMSLLALLGEKRFPVQIHTPTRPHLGVIPTQTAEGDYALLLYHKGGITQHQLQNGGMAPDADIRDTLRSQAAVLRLDLSDLPAGRYTLAHYRLDEVHGHAYRHWQAAGSPAQPSAQLVRQLQAVQEPALIELTEWDLSSDRATRQLDLEMPAAAVSLLRLMKQPERGPQPVANLRLTTYTGLHGHPMTMLNWQDQLNHHVKTYEVWYAAPGETEFVPVQPTDLIDEGFLHLKEAKGGQYQVRAVDFWGRKSDWTRILEE